MALKNISGHTCCVFIAAMVLSLSAASAQGPLAYHKVFGTHLGREDAAALRAAQDTERRAQDLLLRFYENYDAAAEKAVAYGKASDAAAADSLLVGFKAARAAANAAADELASLWERIFDSKTFAYNYLLDVRGERATLAAMERAAQGVMDAVADRRDGEESEQVLNYLETKGLVFEYERTLAKMLGSKETLDSLAGAERVFGLLKRDLPRLELRERSFIVYEAVGIYSPARYNAAKPIPKVAEYRTGIVYRIRLGSYAARQAVNIFKGVWPLGFREEGGKWTYYAGGYADLAGAEKALADLKKRGFGKAVAVVWNDGEMTVLDEGEFRVEIEADELPDAAREAVAAAGRDVVRSGDRFTVGVFGDGMDAERAAAAIRQASPELIIRTVELAGRP